MSYPSYVHIQIWHFTPDSLLGEGEVCGRAGRRSLSASILSLCTNYTTTTYMLCCIICIEATTILLRLLVSCRLVWNINLIKYIKSCHIVQRIFCDNINKAKPLAEISNVKTRSIKWKEWPRIAVWQRCWFEYSQKFTLQHN